MNFQKLFSCMLLSIYCFSSSILSHNAAMHHEDEHSGIQETVSYQDDCCDENNPQDTTSCFKKCFGEYSKIFSVKISLEQFKSLLSIQYIQQSSELTSISENNQIKYSHFSNAPPNIFLSHYIGVVKQTFYA